MIRAAICDDEATVLENLYTHISKEFKQQNADVHIVKFASGKDFLNAHETEPFDVVFLDIDMPGISGFEIAEQINDISNALIVFVTLHDELVYSSLKFRPFRFIRKAHLDNELSETLGSIITETAKRNLDSKFLVQTKSGETLVDLNNVVYIEVCGHWLRMYLKDGKPLECYGSLTSLERELEKLDFVRTHKSFWLTVNTYFPLKKNKWFLKTKRQYLLAVIRPTL